MISLYTLYIFLWGCVYVKWNGLDNGTMTSHCNAVFTLFYYYYYYYYFNLHSSLNEKKKTNFVWFEFKRHIQNVFYKLILHPIITNCIYYLFEKTFCTKSQNKNKLSCFWYGKINIYFQTVFFNNIFTLLHTHTHTHKLTLTDVTI